MNENDARVLQTRRQLRGALIELSGTHGYEAITVRDLAEKAGVGYKTFYRHYDGKEAFLQALVNELAAEAQQLLLPPTDERAPQHNTLAILSYAEAHAELVLTILKTPMRDQLLDVAIGVALADGRQTFRAPGVPDELVAYHFASSISGMVRWWLESGMSASKEEMVGYIERLLLEPLERRDA
jgi:AcrR family transcriptional regulator